MYIEISQEGADQKNHNSAFRTFYKQGQRVAEIIAANKCSPSLATDIMTCLTQLLWLSHALVLDRYRSSISPANWMALVSSGHPDIETMMKTLGDKFIDDLTNNCNDTWVYAKQQELNACLKALTKDVVFVVDEVQLAQGLFEEPDVPHKVKFVNSINERT